MENDMCVAQIIVPVALASQFFSVLGIQFCILNQRRAACGVQNELACESCRLSLVGRSMP